MDRMRVLTIVGARPQFIKAAPLSRVIRTRHDEFLLHTGQHYDMEMSEVFFQQLGIPTPDRNLEVGSGDHGAQTGAILAGVEAVAKEYRPDWVLVYGDTNSTLAGALAAAKLHIRVAHVEAGLRSYDRRMPEEVNRVVADHLSDLLLCPSETAVSNLAREGIRDGVKVTGDVMYDVFLQHVEVARRDCRIVSELGLQPGAFHLLTVHRPENTDDPEHLRGILAGVAVSQKKVVFPAHPRTRSALASSGVGVPTNLMPIDPVGYLEMLTLESAADLILTDSGGVQKEAYFAGKPCLTLRETTEWPETVDAGWNRLVGADPAVIAEAMQSFRPRGPRPEVFGDGHASELVLEALGSWPS
jgi:UDP-N-acetylglucosamine 2-epimerase